MGRSELVCPQCHGMEFAVTTPLTVRQHADGSWDLETPFMYNDEDDAICLEESCDWEGSVRECRNAAKEFYGGGS